ncbi:hypothetical protein EX30DRAFT_36016 [Ascodesmis nigricans]|uniref:Uncharacterized protein n=1 Tax=Ascodesmis nigricans TaxID=341454 RepID=A0A4S2MWL2_9PEZI|nr:hypothetical protein EX30DRAFT_36016 [Ascodesmis nigricans]
MYQVLYRYGYFWSSFSTLPSSSSSPPKKEKNQISTLKTSFFATMAIPYRSLHFHHLSDTEYILPFQVFPTVLHPSPTFSRRSDRAVPQKETPLHQNKKKKKRQKRQKRRKIKSRKKEKKNPHTFGTRNRTELGGARLMMMAWMCRNTLGDGKAEDIHR